MVDVDAAAEDPPLGPLVGAVIGLTLVLGSALWLVATLLSLVPGSVTLAVLLAIVGFLAFVGSMLAWSPSFSER